MTALPDFMQSAAASAVTLGLASYMIPITPMGTLSFVILRPFGLVSPLSIIPIGSGRDITFLTPSAMPDILFSLR